MSALTDPDSLFTQLEAQMQHKRPPVSQWNPDRVGSSAMRIATDGRWFYQESEIRRPEMVRLFATILRRDGNQHFLVTPVERLSIDVDDAPFVAVEFEAKGQGTEQRLVFRTNVDDFVEAGPNHPIRVAATEAGPHPYVLVRDNLEALIARAVYYRLAELVAMGPRRQAGVWSAGVFFPLDVV